MSNAAPRSAGGYLVVYGNRQYRNFKAGQRKPWITTTRRYIRRKLKANDWATKLMIAEAERDLGALEARPMTPGKHGTPLQRAQNIVANIIKQGKQPVLTTEHKNRRSRFTAFDILIVA